jgi:hypothetical protein
MTTSHVGEEGAPVAGTVTIAGAGTEHAMHDWH